MTSRMFVWIEENACLNCGFGILNPMYFHGGSLPDKTISSLSTLQASRSAGCKHCRIILDGIDEFDRTWAKTHSAESPVGVDWHVPQGPPNYHLDRSCVPPRVEVSLDPLRGTLGRSFASYFSICDTTDKPYCLGDTGKVYLDIVDDTTSQQARDRISQWLADCLANHSSCEIQGKFIPTRLVDVRDSEDDWVRLVELDCVVSYMALSYCWGKDLTGIVMSTKNTLQNHLETIKLQSLPATIRDAIFLCRRLGTRYLWVDVLCIIQDDVADWQREAASMRHVYSKSQLTIVAHTAASCKEGFLGKQTSGQSTWQRSFWSDFGATRQRFQLRIGVPVEGKGFSHIEKRGWTLQESVLSPRLLHFTGAEMVWECEEHFLCECGHLQPRMCLKTYFDPDDLTKTSILKSRDVPPARNNIGEMWTLIVQNYTTRVLSYQSDKLIALSGLAQMIHAGTGNTSYRAGLWTSSLPEQLLWERANGPMDQIPWKRISPPIAPTWSWASIDCPIKWPFREGGRSQLVINHDECFCTLLDYNSPFGAVSEGELSLEGFVAPVSLVTDYTYRGLEETVLRGRNGASAKVECDLRRPLDTQRNEKEAVCWGGSCMGSIEEWCKKCKLSPEEWLATRYYCLQVLAYPFRDGYQWPGDTIHFIVLEKSALVEGAFERVGLASIRIGRSQTGQSSRLERVVTLDEYASAWESGGRRTVNGIDVVPAFRDADWRKIRIL